MKYRARSRRRPSVVPGRLVFFTVVAAVLAIAQFAGSHIPSSDLPSVASNWTRQAPAPIEGRATVIDGDTIEIAGQRIRFNGIDAPEGQQYCDDTKGFEYACGRKAANALDGFLSASRPTRCTFVSWDQYDRYVGDCVRADGRSIQEWLVENGHALDWPRYSADAFAIQQDRAKQSHRGVWQGEFQEPWEWRSAQRSEPVPPTATTSPSFTFVGSSGCSIKGNISNKGERIYHLPGQKFYAKTKISEGKGERWFCSEAEARAAGWRRSKQ